MAAHVLLIEDEPNICEAIRFILMRDGFGAGGPGDAPEPPPQGLPGQPPGTGRDPS
jgi:hypothetical protein